ncbi:E3 ubiquitin-protein ligase siah-1 [Orchesella cincta]|uniref:E3 ubiquitin-protein ligase siah-1 n=1 Tax=Orchesella cincta TaxID=48709 RepID=A0A1D2MMR0_ORCCI|nr:E3 ubiquitin-protein ligase siah-1 [Orchesella cincta]
MSTRFPTDPGSLIVFPSQRSMYYEIFGCVGCQKIPNPDNYYVCQQGHHVCSKCSVPADPKESSKGVVLDPRLEQGKNVGLREPCCKRTLRKGPSKLLNTLLMTCRWECKYSDKGCCTNIVGKEWADHVKECPYYRIYSCRYLNCTDKATSALNAVNHLVVAHHATIYEGPMTTLPIAFDLLKEIRRMLAVIQWNDECYLFSSEILDNTIYMWVWNLQAFDNNDGKVRNYSIKLENAVEGDGDTTRENSKTDGNFNGACMPYVLTPSDIISDEDCFIIPLVRFKKRYLKTEGEGRKAVQLFTVTVNVNEKK